MHQHQGFPKFSVIRHGEMEKFVDDHGVPKWPVQLWEINIEIKMAVWQAGSLLLGGFVNVVSLVLAIN